MQLPADLRARALPENTPEARWALVSVPLETSHWSFATHPLQSDVTRWLRTWSDLERPSPCGIFVWGEAGTGKTGLAIASLRVCVERGDGDTGLWNIMALSRTRGMYVPGRLAPAHFSSWRSLIARLQREMRRSGEDGFSDALDERVDVLAVDDLDVGSMSPWKEEVLLHLLRRPTEGRRLILTGNVPPSALAERFGERCADRLLDPDLFTLVAVHGRSWRRRDR